jgi:hypothetical protein
LLVFLIIDFFLNFFGNLFNDLLLIAFLLIGVIVGLWLRPWYGNEVIKLIPRDHRFIDFPVAEETSVSIECNEKRGYPTQRFYKHHPGFTGIVGRFLKKPITRYLGREGTAYTWKVNEGEVEVQGGLAQAIKTICGEDFWDQIPDKQQELLQESRMGVTVGLDEAPIPENLRVVSEEDIQAEEDRKASETFWEGKKKQEKGAWIQWMFIFMSGFGVACALQIIGILRIPSPAPAPTETATQMFMALRILLGV